MFDFLAYRPMNSYMPKPPGDDPVSFIRIINAYNSSKKIDVYGNGRIFTRSLGQKKFTSYMIIQSRQYRINVYRSGKMSNPAADTIYAFEPDMIYTIAVIGDNKGEIIIIRDTKPSIEKGKSGIRAANLCQDAPMVDMITHDGKYIFNGILYKDTTDYISIAPSKYSFKIKPSGSDVSIYTIPIRDIRQDWNYTFYIVKPLSVLMLIDGNTYIKKAKQEAKS